MGNLVKEDMNVWLNKYGLLNKGIWKRLFWNKDEGFISYGYLLKKYGLKKKNDYAFWAFGSTKDMKKQLKEHNENYIPIFNDPEDRYCVSKNGKIIKNWKS